MLWIALGLGRTGVVTRNTVCVPGNPTLPNHIKLCLICSSHPTIPGVFYTLLAGAASSCKSLRETYHLSMLF